MLSKFRTSMAGPSTRITRSVRMELTALAFGGIFVLLSSPIVSAQAPSQKTDVADTWQGTMHIPNQKDLRTVLKVTKADTGALKAAIYSIDQGGQAIPVTTVTFQDGELKYSIERLDGTYDGKMSSDGKSITGQWKQGPNALPLIFERATLDTAWAIPEPPPKVVPMAANADPSFEVATIKPSKPDTPGKGFRMQPDRFSTINTTLDDLIKFAYDVQDKQIINQTPWMDTDKFDIAAQPDTPGAPNKEQLKIMIRKLLADRFQLKFHKDQKELPAYVLTVVKTGPRLKASTDDPNEGGSMLFQGLGSLMVTNSSMFDFAGLMQAAVMDRPVVDHTDLKGKWDFRLKWTPDESQFAGMGVKIPPPGDSLPADAPPPLFTALQEQIGLKMDAAKAQVSVMVLDHVEKPSDN